LDGERVVVAGSTGPGEEEILLDAYARVKAELPEVRLAIVPRRPERFEEVARLISARGFDLVRRSETRAAPAPPNPGAIILGDTMGELMMFYQLAALAFIGRSLAAMGGSNPIDPAGLGLPLVFGPHMFNFPEAEELFAAAGGARVVTGADSLASAFEELLQSPDRLREMGRRARDALRGRQGAAQRNVRLIADVMAGLEESR
jgi:3-deoxy-D-manno-octulosonic-acid transferase